MGNQLQVFALRIIGIYINFLGHVYPREAVRLAEKYISEPRKGKLNPNELPEILKHNVSEVLIWENTPIQTYKWSGNQTVILLVHGWESNASRWFKLIPVLQKSGATIIAIDAPAHGLSGSKWFNVAKYSEFLKVTIDHFKPKFLVGHSIGGTASLFHQFKHQTPEIEKIVVLGSPGELEIMVTNFASIFNLKKRIIELMEKKFFKDHQFNFKSFSLEKMVPSIKSKGLIVHDRTDKVVSYRESKKIAEAWDGVTFITTRGLGHGLQDDALYEKVYQFLFNTP